MQCYQPKKKAIVGSTSDSLLVLETLIKKPNENYDIWIHVSALKTLQEQNSHFKHISAFVDKMI